MTRNELKNKRRIVIKVGTSTVTCENTGEINRKKLENFVEILIELKNQGKEVIVVTSGAVGIGRKILGIEERPQGSVRQACAAVGQGRLMMIYERIFAGYGQLTAQVLLTKESVYSQSCRFHAQKTFGELLEMGVVPIVNANDAISVDEDRYGNFEDNDTMAADVARLVNADLVILMSDIDGLYTDDPRKNSQARFIHTVYKIDEQLEAMAHDTDTKTGTGGMTTKIEAAKRVTRAGADLVIANGNYISSIRDIVAGKMVGTLFKSNEKGCRQAAGGR